MTAKNLTIAQRNLAYLTQLSLSVSNIRKVAAGKQVNPSLSKREIEAAGITIGHNLSDSLFKIINWMQVHYPSQLTYKYRIAKKILIGRHGLKCSSFINEFRVGRSIADCVITNGHSTVYEIKTEFDDPSKLIKQMEDYQKAFRYIYLVIKEGYEDKYLSILNNELDEIGILVFKGNGCLPTIKQAREQTRKLDITTMFSALKKPEYTAICKEIVGQQLAFTDVEHFTLSLEIAQSVSSQEFSQFFENQLKERRVKQCERMKDNLFAPILPMLASINPTYMQMNRIEHWLRGEVH
jgi:hypothetical protein